MLERMTIRTRVLPLLSGAAALVILVAACDAADPPADEAAASDASGVASTAPAEQADQEPMTDPSMTPPEIVVETPPAIPPVLQNSSEMAEALKTVYPKQLREAGVGGTVGLWMYIDETGKIGEAEVRESSGYAEFDEAALRLIGSMVFTPAQDESGQARAVWISQPIQFTTEK